MNESERSELKDLIHKEIVKLEKDSQRLKEFTKPVAPDNAIGRLTRMEAINAKNMNEANLRQAMLRISKLKQTLTRMDDEEFGICLSCERPIPMKRIMVAPESTRCVRCLSR